MTKQCTAKPRITIRLTPYQKQVLDELKDKLDCSYCSLIRCIIGDWIKQNEEHLERIMDGED